MEGQPKLVPHVRATVKVDARFALANQCSLSQAGQRNVLITSALPYCNNAPHLGNLVRNAITEAVCFL